MTMTDNTKAKDPVCGMTVDPHTTPHRHSHHGKAYYFCSGGCRTKFAASPEKFLDPSAQRLIPGHVLLLSHVPDVFDVRQCPVGKPSR